eukprot:jgi/Mesen1/793/ME000110S_11064
MRHRNAFRKLGRTSSHRWSMLRTMVSQLLLHERIETTLPKAKELRRVADNMVQLGKDGQGGGVHKGAADEDTHDGCGAHGLYRIGGQADGAKAMQASKDTAARTLSPSPLAASPAR